MEIVSIPVTMFDDYPFEPQFHINCDSNAFSRHLASQISDGLPKYADLPEEVSHVMLCVANLELNLHLLIADWRLWQVVSGPQHNNHRSKSLATCRDYTTSLCTRPELASFISQLFHP